MSYTLSQVSIISSTDFTKEIVEEIAWFLYIPFGHLLSEHDTRPSDPHVQVLQPSPLGKLCPTLYLRPL